jgi:hypothetical protein
MEIYKKTFQGLSKGTGEAGQTVYHRNCRSYQRRRC